MWCVRLIIDCVTRVTNQSSIQLHRGNTSWSALLDQVVTTCPVFTPLCPSDGSAELQKQPLSSPSEYYETDLLTLLSPCEPDQTVLAQQQTAQTGNATHSYWLLPFTNRVLFVPGLIHVANWPCTTNLVFQLIQRTALNALFSCRIIASLFVHEHFSAVLSALFSRPLLLSVSNPLSNRFPVITHTAWNCAFLTLLFLVSVTDASVSKVWTSTRSSSLDQAGFSSLDGAVRSAVQPFRDNIDDDDYVNSDGLSTRLNQLSTYGSAVKKPQINRAVLLAIDTASVAPTAKSTSSTTTYATSGGSAPIFQDSAANTNNPGTPHLPLVFVLAAVLLCLVIFTVFLTFWCVYQKHARRPVLAQQQEVHRDPEVAEVIEEGKSTEEEHSIGFSRSEGTEIRNRLKGPENQASIGTAVNLLKPCYAFFSCCLRSKAHACGGTDLAVTPSGTATCVILDDSELDTGSGKVSSLPSSSTSVPTPFGKPKSASHSVIDLACAESSISPSLASRRHAVPPPPLLHTVMPSILTPSLPIQTRAVHVQPLKRPHYDPDPSDDGDWFTHSNCPSSTDAGSSMVATTLVSEGPSACMCSTHTALCASAGPVDSMRETMGSARGKFIPLRFTALSSPGVASRTKSGLSPQDSAANASPSLTKVHSVPLRARTKGLLESRRGSHTSLTLSLSPSVETPLAPCSAGLILIGHDAHVAASLDETSICAVSDMALPSQSQHSPLPVQSDSPICPAQLAESSPDSAVVLADREPCSLVTLESANPEFQEFKDPGEQRSSSPRNERDSRDPFNLCLNQRLMHPLCYFHHHRHHHHHHHHHYHHHYRHHQLHGAYYRTDNNLPCPHGSQSCQRSRDVEQLMNASQPMTCEEMLNKLRDSFSSLSTEFWNIPMNHASKKDLPISGIGQKNRYQSILPNFATRVVLPTINNDPATSYINANYIRGYAGQPNAFIATQGPMSHTVIDFWRMVWHSHAPAIVMITKLVEKRDVKCELYLPHNPVDETVISVQATTPVSSVSQTGSSFSSGSPLSSTSHSVSTTDSGAQPAQLLGRLSRLSDSGVTSLDERPDTSGLQPVDEEEDDESGSKPTTCASPDSSQSMALAGASHTYGDIHVQVESVQRCTGYSVRHLRLRRNTEERRVTHFWYTAWPDHSSPESSPASARQLLQLVRDAESCRGRVSTASVLSHSHWINPQEASATLFQSQPTVDADRTQLLDPSPSDTATTNTGAHVLSTSTDGGGPIVVHCSAGLGRTGCFIALCIGCEQLRREGVADVLQIVSRLRLDRGGMVQTNEQYEFIYYALATYSAISSATSPPTLPPVPDDMESSLRSALSPNVFPPSDI